MSAATVSENLPQNRRAIRRIFIKPRQQLRYAFFFFGGGLTLITVFMVVFMMFLSQRLTVLGGLYMFEPEVTEALRSSITSAVGVVILLAGSMAVVMFAMGVALSHRVFGPIVPIKRAIEQLAEGDYSARAHIREKDEFQDVMEAVNRLAQVLESKYGAKGTERG